MKNDKASAGVILQVIRFLLRPEVTIALLIIALLFRKFRLMAPAARGSILFAMLQHDCEIFALLLLFYAAASACTTVSRNSSHKPVATVLSKLCIFVFLVVALLYTADVFAYNFFITRLYASDIVTFSSESHGVFSLLRSGLGVLGAHAKWKLAVDALIAVLLLRSCYLLLVRPVRSPLPSRFLVGATVPLIVFWLLPIPGYVYSFVDRPLFENFIERNHNFYVRNTFSDSFRDRILAAPPPLMTCAPGRGRRLNVILVIVESLSAYQSHFFSGINDWTPQLDDIARNGTALTNFYANGWTTAGGLVSLLTGTAPLVPELRTSRSEAFTPVGGTSLTDYMNLPNPLPQVLLSEGYATEFVAPGDLKFLGQDKWLPNIGFQKIIKGDDPRFAAQKLRGPFDSVPDRLLFSVAFEEVERMPAGRPFFMTVQTFWSHRPFMDPNDNGVVHGQEPVFRDTDAQIGTFYKRLMASGFFQNGLLFITGDHRAMEPFQRQEFQRFGTSAPARIPAVIATHAVNLPPVLPQDFQQRDFPASIEALVGDRYCLRSLQGSFLSDPPKPPSCIMQVRGDDRDLIFVHCGTAEGSVLARGDATSFVSGAVPDEASIIQTINRTRVRPIN